MDARRLSLLPSDHDLATMRAVHLWTGALFAISLLIPTARTFNILDPYATCAWISPQIQLSDAERAQSQGAVLLLTRSQVETDPPLYNTSVAWDQFTKYGPPYATTNFTYSSLGKYSFNVSTLSAVNASWIVQDRYEDPAQLFMWLYTQSSNSTSPQDFRPVYINGTHVVNTQSASVTNLYCDLYLTPNGTYSGYYPGRDSSSDGDSDDGNNSPVSVGVRAALIVIGFLIAVVIVAFVIYRLKRRGGSLRTAIGQDNGAGDEDNEHMSATLPTLTRPALQEHKPADDDEQQQQPPPPYVENANRDRNNFEMV